MSAPTTAPAATSGRLVELARARVTAGGADAIAPLPGFVDSTFGPLVAQAADGCLRRAHGTAPAAASRGERTAVVVVSARGDLGTAAAIADAVDHGRRVMPLLFFQSVPNAVAGRVAAAWGLRGPVVCTSPVGDPLADALDLADLLVSDGDADEVLLVLVEQACLDGEHDQALALLVGPQARPPDSFRSGGDAE
jgi:hypothetical protein